MIFLGNNDTNILVYGLATKESRSPGSPYGFNPRHYNPSFKDRTCLTELFSVLCPRSIQGIEIVVWRVLDLMLKPA